MKWTHPANCPQLNIADPPHGMPTTQIYTIYHRLSYVLEATSMSLAKLQEAVKDRRAWRALVRGPWGHEESDTTERLNNNNISFAHYIVPFHALDV